MESSSPFEICIDVLYFVICIIPFCCYAFLWLHKDKLAPRLALQKKMKENKFQRRPYRSFQKSSGFEIRSIMASCSYWYKLRNSNNVGGVCSHRKLKQEQTESVVIIIVSRFIGVIKQQKWVQLLVLFICFVIKGEGSNMWLQPNNKLWMSSPRRMRIGGSFGIKQQIIRLRSQSVAMTGSQQTQGSGLWRGNKIIKIAWKRGWNSGDRQHSIWNQIQSLEIRWAQHQYQPTTQSILLGITRRERQKKHLRRAQRDRERERDNGMDGHDMVMVMVNGIRSYRIQGGTLIFKIYGPS